MRKPRPPTNERDQFERRKLHYAQPLEENKRLASFGFLRLLSAIYNPKGRLDLIYKQARNMARHALVYIQKRDHQRVKEILSKSKK